MITEDRAGLTELMRTLTGQLRSLATGGPATEAFNAGIAGDNGMLGPDIPAHQLIATVGVGSSLFDDRFGLTARKPKGLVPMRTFPYVPAPRMRGCIAGQSVGAAHLLL